MARNVSPFASLTSEEKQIKWMEYQTIRLPYTQVANTDWKETQSAECPTEPAHQAAAVRSESADGSGNRPMPAEAYQSQLPSDQQAYFNPKNNRPIPPPEVFAGSQAGYPQTSPSTNNQQPNNATPSAYQLLNQKTRHRQYDAVIERMKQAAQKTGSYTHWSK